MAGRKKPDAREIVRVWAADGDIQVVLESAFDDPFIWGMLLVDLLGHVANMCGGQDLTAVQRARERVLEGFRAELNHPTDIPKDITAESAE